MQRTAPSPIRTAALLALLCSVTALPALADQAAAAAEVTAKREACGAVMPRTNASSKCATTCNSALSRLASSRQFPAEAVARLTTACNQAYAAAGFNLDAKPPKPPTEDERFAALPGKAAFCSEALASRGCTRDDIRDPRSVCGLLSACQRDCSTKLAEVEASADPRTMNTQANAVRKANARTLSMCETQHAQAVEMLGG